MGIRRCQKCNAKIPRSTRAPNEWNKFVQKTMQDPEILQLENPRDKMRAVAAKWRMLKTLKASKS